MLVIRNASQIICVSQTGERRKGGDAMRSLAILTDASLIAENQKITWVGPTAQLPPIPPDAEIIDATGKTVLPGFVDSHTHLIFAGTREDEFEQRLQGVSYQQIAAQGGGINATAQQVRRASKEELKALARSRLDRLLRFGVTTVRVQS